MKPLISNDWLSRQLSLEALESVEDRLGAIQAVVRAVLVASPNGCTAEEVEERAGLRGSTVRPRLLELEKLGLVERSNHIRLTRSGRRAMVWYAVKRETA